MTSSSLPKMPIFAAFGVPEVWRIAGGRVEIHRLRGGAYEPSNASLALPVLTRDRLDAFLTENRRLGSADRFQYVLAWATEQAPGP